MTETYANLAGLRPYALKDGVVGRAIHGERLTLAVIDMAAGVSESQHGHPFEQLGFVARGSIHMAVAGRSRLLQVGDTYVIPGDVIHSSTAGPDGVTTVEVFAPVRADWQSRTRLGPFPPDWPAGIRG